MNEKELSYGILRAVAIFLGVAFLLYFLYLIQSVLVYIAIAGVISLVGRPVVIFLRTQLRVPNQIAVVIVLLLVLCSIVGLITIFIPIVIEQSKNLGQIDVDAFTRDLNELNRQINNYLGVEEIDLIEGISRTEFVRNFDFATIPRYLNSFFGILGAGMIAIFSIIFISFFFLKDSRLMLNSILVFSNKGHEEKFKSVFNKIKVLLSRYFVGLTLQITVLFILYSFLLSLFEIKNPIAIAFICAFLNIVPYLGPIISGILISLFVISISRVSRFTILYSLKDSLAITFTAVYKGTATTIPIIPVMIRPQRYYTTAEYFLMLLPPRKSIKNTAAWYRNLLQGPINRTLCR